MVKRIAPIRINERPPKGRAAIRRGLAATAVTHNNALSWAVRPPATFARNDLKAALTILRGLLSFRARSRDGFDEHQRTQLRGCSDDEKKQADLKQIPL